MLLSYMVISAQPAPSYIQNRAGLNQAILSERVLLNTDRDLYMCGEDIVFDAYTYDGNWFLPLTISSVLYVELYLQDNTVVSSAKLLIRNGKTSGVITIPVSAKSDIYYLRAYTNYMKNFGIHSFFTEKLRIINPFFRYSGNSLKTSGKEILKCSVYPEGGKIISNINNHIVCRFTGDNVKGIPVIARLVDSNDSIITNFQTYKNGFAEFNFKPAKGINYFIEAANSTNQSRVPLPPATPGIKLSVDTITTEYLKIKIISADSLLPPMMINARHGDLSYPLRETFINNAGTFDIPVQKIPKGLVDLELTGFGGEKISHRYFYNQTEKINLNIASDKKDYGYREKVEISVNSPGLKGTPISEFVASVTLADTVQSNYYIPDPLIISYEMRQYSLYGNELIYNAIADKKLLDLILVTLPELKKNPAPEQNKTLMHLPEKEGDIISGTLFFPGKKPAGNIKIMQSYVGSVSWIESTRTNENGEFFFLCKNQRNKGDLILKANSDQPIEVTLNDEFYPDFPEPSSEILSVTQDETDLISQQFINIQVTDLFQNAYKNIPIPDTLAFYGNEYMEYYFNKYIRLPNMTEFIFEVVDGVVVVKENRQEVICVLDENNKKIGPDPLIIVDGIPVSDYSKIFNIPPKDVKLVRVLRSKYFYKQNMYDGIFDIITFANDGSSVETPPNTFRLRNVPLQNGKVFVEYNPLPYTNDRVPMYRNLIYFNSDIPGDSKGTGTFSFYTPDNSGILKVSCTGRTMDGETGTSDIYIKVGE